MGLLMTETRFDADTYLAWEAGQPGKSEFVAGEVFAMVGVRRAHATAALNVGAAMREHLRGSPCLPFISDMKLRVAAVDAFFYPEKRDATLFLLKPQSSASQSGERSLPVLNLHIVFEVRRTRWHSGNSYKPFRPLALLK
jgi:hypothetical protein